MTTDPTYPDFIELDCPVCGIVDAYLSESYPHVRADCGECEPPRYIKFLKRTPAVLHALGVCQRNPRSAPVVPTQGKLF